MNKKLLYCAAVLAATLFSTFSYAQLDSGLIGHYSFNGDLKDNTGSGRDATAGSGVSLTMDRDGNANSAYHLNGSATISIAHDPAFNDMSQAFTISMWVKQDNQAGQYHVLMSKLNGGTREVVWREQDNGLLHAHFNSGGLKFCTSPSTIMTTNEWQHIALVWTGADMLQYRNGVEEKLCDFGGQNVTIAGGNWSIGSLGGGETFTGSVDEVRLWTRALDSTEVVESAEMDKVKYSDLVIDMPFNGDAMDHSKFENDGTVQGATLVQDRFGNADAAYYFDGINDFIEIADDESYKTQLPVSVSMWVWTQDSAQQSSRIFTTNNHESRYYGMALNGGHSAVDNLGAFSASWGTGQGAGSQHRRSVISPDVINNKNWHHLVVVMRGANDMDFYVDGVASASTFSGTGSSTIAYTNDPARIAAFDRSGGDTTGYFEGAIDDLKVWNTDLTAADVAELHVVGSNNEVISGINPFAIKVSETVALFPNPATSMINVVGEYSSTATFAISGMDATSKVDGFIGNGSINIADLDQGLYIIEIVDGEKVTQSKFMKQ